MAPQRDTRAGHPSEGASLLSPLSHRRPENHSYSTFREESHQSTANHSVHRSELDEHDSSEDEVDDTVPSYHEGDSPLPQYRDIEPPPPAYLIRQPKWFRRIVSVGAPIQDPYSGSADMEHGVSDIDAGEESSHVDGMPLHFGRCSLHCAPFEGPSRHREYHARRGRRYDQNGAPGINVECCLAVGLFFVLCMIMLIANNMWQLRNDDERRSAAMWAITMAY